VCLACGATRFKALRLGVSRVREDLERLAGVPVAEITGEAGELPDAAVYVGTEAVLHRVRDVTAVAFLDIDQELLAPRYRAAEQAMALLIRAGRLVGGRHGGGRVLVQTRVPKHEVLDAALHGDPDRLTTVELERRRGLTFPPFAALAEVSGPAAPAYVEALGRPLGVDVLGPTDGRWLLRASDHGTLCDALAATARPSGRLRVEVDPVRL
jgi:primosomal protein N' (replication factor Y)